MTLAWMLHAFAIQFVEEWHEGHQPLLIMECAPGGNTRPPDEQTPYYRRCI